MIINNNIPALNTHRQLGINQNAMQNSMEKLSSGLRINRAGDDAAGLAISEKMRAQVRGLDQASRNAQDGISMIQTAEGALQETQSILQRMRELAIQAANDTNVDVDRNEIQKEMNQLTSEINRIGNTTEFNQQNLLDGGDGGGAIGSVSTTPADTSDSDPSNHTPGSTTFEITEALQAGDVIEVAGETITVYETDSERDAASGLAISLESASTTEDQADAIRNLSFGSELTTSGSGSTVTITQVTAGTGDITEATLSNEAGGFTATFQIGANNGQSMTINVLDMRAEALGVASETNATDTTLTPGDSTSELTGKDTAVPNGAFASEAGVSDGTTNNTEQRALSVANHEEASAAIEVINNAIEAVSAQRSELGAYQNRLEHTISNLDNSSENLQAAESRIRDVDMAAEMMEMTRANILSQASQSMLAQANQQPQSVLQLLG